MTGALPLRRGVSLAPFTSLKVGGPADVFLQSAAPDDLARALAWAEEQSLPVHVIGGGSNLLVSDEGVEGLVVRVAGGEARVEDRGGDPVLVASAGVTLANIARRISRQELGGLEWASNVPGTVGGAVVNNAGAFGGDTASSLVGAAIVRSDGTHLRMSASDLAYGYRTSTLKRRELGSVAVVRAEFRLTRSPSEDPSALVSAYQAQRSRTQPRQLSAGSVFANPPGTFSGRLIEEAGLKGARVGRAEISTVHANFIVNPGGARALDVWRLMRLAQDSVFERSGTWLRAEIELLGRWSPEQLQALREPAAAVGGPAASDRGPFA